MIKINKKIEYALMALKYMSRQNQTNTGETQLISAREICDRFKTPFDTTAKVLQIMNNHGVLNSTKGIKGGYSLALPLSQVTFRDLVEMIEGRDKSASLCESTRGRCDLYEQCNIVTPLDLLNKKVSDFLSQLTLEELLLNEQANDLLALMEKNAQESHLEHETPTSAPENI